MGNVAAPRPNIGSTKLIFKALINICIRGNSTFWVNSIHIFSGIIVLKVSWNIPVKSSLDVTAEIINNKKIIGNNQNKLLIESTKGIERKRLAHAFLELVSIAANPILKKNEIAVYFFNELLVFSSKIAIENGHTKLNQAPA